jgi:2-methylcitrate dehydratase PrpD
MADIDRIETLVHQGAIDVLGPASDATTLHQSKFSMGTVLALICKFQFAGLDEFAKHFNDPEICALRHRVSMILDPEVDKAYPQRWIGKVKVYLKNGRVYEGRVDEPKGDPGNTLTRAEITEKALRLASFSGGATESEMHDAIALLFDIRRVNTVPFIFSK